MKSWRKYMWVALVSGRSNLAYIGEVLSRTVFLAVILYIFFKLWQVAYAETGAKDLGGLTLPEMLWYLMIAESIIMSGPQVTRAVDEDVRTGALAVYLVRPISYPLYRLSVTSGERLVRFCIIAATGAVIATILVGPICLHPTGLLFFAVSLPLAGVVPFLVEIGNPCLGADLN